MLDDTGERFNPGMTGEIELEHVHRYRFASQFVAGMRVLDIASGSGYGSALLATTARAVVGVDRDRRAIDFSIATYRRPNLSFLEGDCAKIPIADGSVDVVVSYETLEHVEDQVELMSEIRRVLTSSGLLVMSTPDRVQYSEIPGYCNPFHVHELSRLEFADLIGAYFRRFKLLGQSIVPYSQIGRERGSPGKVETFEWGKDHSLSVGVGVEFPAPRYILAVASDQSLPHIRVGLIGSKRVVGVPAALTLPPTAEMLVPGSGGAEGVAASSADAPVTEHVIASDALDSRPNDSAMVIEELKGAQRQLLILQAELDGAHLRERRLQHDVAAESARSAELGALLRLSQDRAARGEEELRSLLGSTSWRVTALARRVGRVARQGAAREKGASPGGGAARGDVNLGGGTGISEVLPASSEGGAPSLLQEWAELDESGIALDGSAALLIALYLPQSQALGNSGHTLTSGPVTWAQVSAARALFPGHQQPRVPMELGYYDTRVDQIVERQVALARLHGIGAFCFYDRWSPPAATHPDILETFLRRKELQMQFCICWVPQSLGPPAATGSTPSWADATPLAEQVAAFVEASEVALRDDRYIRVSGRPLILIHSDSAPPEQQAILSAVKGRASALGLVEPIVAGTAELGSSGDAVTAWDAVVAWPRGALDGGAGVLDKGPGAPGFVPRSREYEEVVMAACREYEAAPPSVGRWPLVVSGFDNTPVKGVNGTVLARSNPWNYKRWLVAAIKASAQWNGDSSGLVFINAWNNWGEGAFLEPDQEYGYGYLRATKEALQESERTKPGPRIAVVVHLFYPEMWEEIAAGLVRLPWNFDLWVSTPTGFPDAVRERVLRRFPEARVTAVRNQGRDVLPFLRFMRLARGEGYELVCKVHTKLSRHRADGGMWRRAMLRDLIGGVDACQKILTAFEEDPSLGLVVPEQCALQSTYYWGAGEAGSRNRERVRALATSIGLTPEADFVFPAGSMFWFRWKALERLSDLPLEAGDFEWEAGQTDGTMSHALERFFGMVCLQSGYQVGEVNGLRWTQSTCRWTGDGSDVRWSEIAGATLNGEILQRR